MQITLRAKRGRVGVFARFAAPWREIYLRLGQPDCTAAIVDDRGMVIVEELKNRQLYQVTLTLYNASVVGILGNDRWAIADRVSLPWETQ